MERKIDIVQGIFDPYVMAFLLIFILSIYTIVKYRNNRRLVLFGLLWFLIMLLPQSSLVFPTILAEHFLYLPCIGIFLILGILLEGIWQRRKKYAFVILGIWISFYSSLLVIHNIIWRNPLSFYTWTLSFSPNAYNINCSLANYYADTGQFDLAIGQYRKVMGMAGKDKKGATLLAAMHHNIGTMLSRKGLPDEAEREYIKSIELDPKLIDSYNDLGCLYINRAEYSKAEEILNSALKVNPKSEKIYYNLGVIYAQKNDFEKASALWKKALEINPNYNVAKEAIKSLDNENPK